VFGKTEFRSVVELVEAVFSGVFTPPLAAAIANEICVHYTLNLWSTMQARKIKKGETRMSKAKKNATRKNTTINFDNTVHE